MSVRVGVVTVSDRCSQGEMEDRRLEQLKETLRPAITLVRQLDIDPGDAVDLYRELLDDTEADQGKGQR